jgi:hypothetical protein
MSVNGISTTSSSYESTSAKTKPASADAKNVSEENAQNTKAAVYEKSSKSSGKDPVYKQDTATISQLKADVERRTGQLRSLVEKMFLKQGQTLDDANMYKLLREGKVPVDAKTADQAKSDIAEDGYWGVNQTSDRLVSFAMALSGGDPSKADEMIAAVKKGFEQATKSWGAELPDISKQTLDATLKKLDDWKNSLTDVTA